MLTIVTFGDWLYDSSRAPRSVLVRMVRAGALGLAYGGVLAIGVTLSTLTGRNGLQTLGITLWEATAIYLLGGLASGCLVGLLSPLGAHRWGRMLIGFIASLPAAGLIGVVLIPPDAWGEELLPTSLVFAAIVGPLHALAWEAEGI